MSAGLTFVLLFSFSEEGQDTASHRPGKIIDSETELVVCLCSIEKRFKDISNIEFFIVTPFRGYALLEKLVLQLNLQINIRYVFDEDLISDETISIKNGLKGWYRQQLLKLLIVERVNTEFYITLDSDVVLIKRCTRDDLISFNKGCVGIETIDDYKKLYNSKFAETESEIKWRRYKTSSGILSLSLESLSDLKIYNETPAVLNKKIAQNLINHLSAELGDDWHLKLLDTEGWTEYALYYLIAHKTRMFDIFHTERPYGYILDLKRSAYHENNRYIYSERTYADLMKIDDKSNGFFRVYQSWISPQHWLPRNIFTKKMFYRKVAVDLGLEKALQHFDK